MICLTSSETAKLLADRRTPQDPYARENTSAYYLQFAAPHRYSVIAAFVRQFVNQLPPSDLLIDFMDWANYQPDEMLAMDALRQMHGETTTLIDAPGHLLAEAEELMAITLFSQGISFGWTTYLYSLEHRTVLLNWEGERLDFWTDNCELFEAVKKLARSFELG